MKYDHNKLEVLAGNFVKENDFRNALRIYFYIADGDPSLDAGYLALRIGECYEALGELYAAKYWFGIASVEGAGAWEEATKGLERLGPIVDIDDIVK